MSNFKAFRKEYQELVKKHGVDIAVFPEVRSSILRFMIRILGQHTVVAKIEYRKTDGKNNS